MLCRKELLELYIDNRLEPAERTQLAAHLDSCAYCQAELQQIEHVVMRLQGLKTVEPDEQFLSDIMQKIESVPNPLAVELRRRRTIGRILAWVSVILASAVLTGILILVNHYSGDFAKPALIGLWQGVAALFAPGDELLGWWQGAKNSVILAADLLVGNRPLLLFLVVSCLLVITMTREIVADVQRVFGHKQ